MEHSIPMGMKCSSHKGIAKDSKENILFSADIMQLFDGTAELWYVPGSLGMFSAITIFLTVSGDIFNVKFIVTVTKST